MITKIERWKTDDGREHPSMRSALLHAAEGALRDFVRRESPRLEELRVVGAEHGTADWLVENTNELALLFAALESAVQEDP